MNDFGSSSFKQAKEKAGLIMSTMQDALKAINKGKFAGVIMAEANGDGGSTLIAGDDGISVTGASQAVETEISERQRSVSLG